MRKPAFCICENKDADQLRGNREADQRLCFRYTDNTIPLLHIYEISSLLPSWVVVRPGLCWTRLETPKTGFLTKRLNLCNLYPTSHVSTLSSYFCKRIESGHEKTCFLHICENKGADQLCGNFRN